MKQKTEKKKFRVGAAIFRFFLILIAGLTVGLAVFSFNANRIGGNQLPMPFGYGASVVLSGSMEPALLVNDFVIVEEEENYDVGDVVVYQNGKDLIIHRIVKKDGEEFVTRGDANNVDDDPIKLSDIKGKMIFRIPFVGLIFKWLKTLPGTLIVLGLAIFLLYRSRRKEKEKDSQQLDEIVEEIRRLQALQQEDAVQQTAQPQPAGVAVQPVEEKAPEPDTPQEETPAPTENVGDPSQDAAENGEPQEGKDHSDSHEPAEDHPENEDGEASQADAPDKDAPEKKEESADDLSDIGDMLSKLESDH